MTRTPEIETMLDAWKRGDIVESIEMGGIGPAYEQAIQILAFELLEAFTDSARPLDPNDNMAVVKRRDEVISRLNPTYGFSGAQVGAAANFAFAIARKGGLSWHLAEQQDLENRRILVCRHFPAEPTPTS